MTISNEMKISDYQQKISDYQQKRLAELIKQFGENSRMVGHFRNQIAASQSGQSAQQMYITGMMKRAPT